MVNKKLSKREFFELLSDPDIPKSATHGKARWEEIFKELKKTNEPLSIKQIHEEYVKEVVSRYRTKNVLQMWALEGKCKQIWYKGMYWFFFGRAPRKRKKKPEPQEE